MKTGIFVSIATLFAGAASAADLPTRDVRLAVAPPPSFLLFDGFYAGGQIGWAGFGDRTQSLFSPADILLTQTKSHGSSLIGGVHAGYDWRIGPVVLGVVGDINGADGVTNNADLFAGYAVASRTDVQGALRGRVGYAFDRMLLYVTGGVNFAHVERAYHALAAYQKYDHVAVQPTLGAGLEYAIDDHWSVGLEYIASGTYTPSEASNPLLPLLSTRHRGGNSSLKLKVSYRFITR